MSNNFYDRSIALTGVLSPPVIVNNDHLLRPISYSVQMQANINVDNLYMQGGPGKTVASFEKKIIAGALSTPIKISESNTFPLAIVDLINSAIDFNSVLSLATLLNPYNPDLIAEGVPYLQPNNSLIFDTCIIEELKLVLKKQGEAKIEIKIKGMVDFSNIVPIVIPPDDTNLYRNLTWYDCLFSRNGSQLDNAEEIEITITKEVDERYFLMSCVEGNRTDAPYSLGIKSVSVDFKIVEYLTSAFDVFSYSLGGNFDDFNLTGHVGNLNFSIPNAILKISTQNLTADIIERTTEGFYRMSPNTVYNPDFVFSIT